MAHHSARVTVVAANAKQADAMLERFAAGPHPLALVREDV